MTLRELATLLEWDALSEGSGLDVAVLGCYSGDLLSHALASAEPGQIWITIQRHANVVAVAQVAGLAGILLACGSRASDSVIERAREGGVPMLTSPDSAFVLAGRIHRALFPEAQ
jgi:predicted transcriptional regulator